MLRNDATWTFDDSSTSTDDISGNAAGTLDDLNAYLSLSESLKPSGPITVNSLNSCDDTPAITGTASLSFSSGDYLSVILDGVSYVYTGDVSMTTDISFNNTTNQWSLQIPSALATGTYDVDASIYNSGGYQLLDTTSSELEVIENILPTMTFQMFSYNENRVEGQTIGTVTVTTGENLSYSIVSLPPSSGPSFSSYADGTSYFSINPSTGELSLNSTGISSPANDFEQLPNNFEIQVQVTNTCSETTSATMYLTVVNVDESETIPPVINNQSFNYAENQSSGYSVGTVVATDNIGVSSYVISNGNDDGYFEINSTSGEITLTVSGTTNPVASNDFETGTNTFTLIVEVSDAASNTSSATIIINVTDLDDAAPTFGSSSDNTFTYAENQSSGYSVGTVSATDNIGVTSLDIISGNDDVYFEIDSLTGEITLTVSGTTNPVASNDFETGSNTFTLIVEARDLASNTSTSTITINVTDLDDAAPTFGSSSDNTFTYVENQSSGYAVGTVSATDNVGVSSYSIQSGNANGYFAINASTGAITLTATGTSNPVASNDFETGSNTFTLVVEVSDAASNTTTGTVTINVTDVVEDRDGDGVIDTDEIIDGTDPDDSCDYNPTSFSTIPTTSNTALNFDGINDYVEFYPNAPLFDNNQMTVEAWIKTTDNSLQDTFVGWSKFAANDNVQFRLESGYLQFGMHDYTNNTGGWTSVKGQTIINDDKWHHVAFVKDGALVRLYVDGQLDAESNLNRTMTVDVFRLGGGTTTFYEGSIDHIKIWNSAKSSTEILDNRFNDLVGNELDLIAYYDFDQAFESSDNTSNTTLYDQSDSNLNQNGNLMNMSLSGSTSNYVKGYMPSIQYDGELLLNSQSEVTLTHGFSGGTWISSNPLIASLDLSGTISIIESGDVSFTYQLCNLSDVITFSIDADLPKVPSNQIFTYAENQSSGYAVGTVSATDNVGVSSYSIQSGNANGYFAINASTGAITLSATGTTNPVASNDFETGSNTFTLVVEVTDAASNTTTGTVTINVTDINEILDTDGDGVQDVDELNDGTDPNAPCDYIISSRTLTPTTAWDLLDCDGDGDPNGTDPDPKDECAYGDSQVVANATSAWKALDCDGDGDPNETDKDPNDSCVFSSSQDPTNATSAWKALDCDGDGDPNGTDPKPYDSCVWGTSRIASNATSVWGALDCDNDGITNNDEINKSGTDPMNPDSDGDGVLDGQEFNFDGTNPADPCSLILSHQTVTPTEAWGNLDCDNDGLPNKEEKKEGTNPFDKDTDGDGVTDQDEVTDGTDPLDPCSYEFASQTMTPTEAWGTLDCDNDGLPNENEIENGTDPANPDTDGDGVTDNDEVNDQTNPNDPCEFKSVSISVTPSEAWGKLDCDNDGLQNNDEPIGSGSTDVKNPDTDGDGVLDGTEVNDGTDPLDYCSYIASHQTLEPSDAWKVADCDTDLLSNQEEKMIGTNPNDPDTDKDGVLDGMEVDDNTNPLDPCSLIREHQSVIENIAIWNMMDCDGDSLENGGERYEDTDRDYLPNFLDPDDDGDNIQTIDEFPDPNNDASDSDALDANNNQVPDYLEANRRSVIKHGVLEVYNGLTPNGDGLHDVFTIRNIELYPDNNLKIYNRWGTQVYEADGYGINGKFFRGYKTGGGSLPSGVYYYLLKYNEDGVYRNKQGYLYLNR